MSTTEKLITKLRKWRTDDAILRELDKVDFLCLWGRIISFMGFFFGIVGLQENIGTPMVALGFGAIVYSASALAFYTSNRLRVSLLSRIADEYPEYDILGEFRPSLTYYIPILGMFFFIFSMGEVWDASTHRTRMYKTASDKLDQADAVITEHGIRSRLPSESNVSLTDYADAARVVERGEKVYQGSHHAVDEVPIIDDFETAYKAAERAMTLAAEQAELLAEIEWIESKHSDRMECEIQDLLIRARKCTAEADFDKAQDLINEAQSRGKRSSSS